MANNAIWVQMPSWSTRLATGALSIHNANAVDAYANNIAKFTMYYKNKLNISLMLT